MCVADTHAFVTIVDEMGRNRRNMNTVWLYLETFEGGEKALSVLVEVDKTFSGMHITVGMANNSLVPLCTVGLC